MEPRDALVTIHRTAKVPYGIASDGNTTLYKWAQEDELVSARVWPVSMGEHKMLVEYDDGRLDTADLWDIELVVDQ